MYFIIENVNSQKQICYMPGNPVFSCVNPPPSISNNLYINEDEGKFSP